jgi:hypothetical protein
MLSATSFAQEPSRAGEIRQLQAVLATINAELKSDLDQVLVLQEAIRGNARKSLAAQGRSPEIVSVEDALAADRRAIEREDAINLRLDALLARSSALDAQKQPLLERLWELGAAPQTPDARIAAKKR